MGGGTSTEAVRLVIWDLDETFWRGTLSEGGIREYVPAHHEAVVALAQRGIMSSICSKNDPHHARRVLEESGLWDYFVFPSIDWSPKGMRIARIVEQVQLRPETILFVDDNPANLAEAQAHLPGLRIADPAIIPTMLDHALFQGKDDSALTRLAQYKLLERREDDAAQAGGDAEAFLRASDIRVTLDTDIEANIDRAIELINRTNQLNFTKRRLPSDPEAARMQLRAEISPFNIQAGLIKVSDRYGDYGICGYYQMHDLFRGRRLQYFCFSCRILGMGVEKWLYDRLGQPEIDIPGDVLTDLRETRTIDWIGIGAHGAGPHARETAIPEMIVRGGCELDPIGHYGRWITPHVTAETNRTSWRIFLKYNSSANLLLTLKTDWSAAEREELERIGFTADDLTSRLWDIQPGGIAMFCGWVDLHAPRYRHKAMGLEAVFQLLHLQTDLFSHTEERLEAYKAFTNSTDQQMHNVRMWLEHIRLHYDLLPIGLTEAQIEENYTRIFSAFPAHATLYMLLPHTKGVIGEPRHFVDRPTAVVYNAQVRKVAAAFPYVKIIEIDDFVTRVDECQMAVDHFERTVYYRIFQRLMADLER